MIHLAVSFCTELERASMFEQKFKSMPGNAAYRLSVVRLVGRYLRATHTETMQL